MGRFIVFIIISALIFFEGPNYGIFSPVAIPSCEVENPAGFLGGLAHGFLALWLFLAGLVGFDVGMYELCNKGSVYNGGFMLGLLSYYFLFPNKD